MPAKAKVTKAMIIDAAFEIVREAGIENVNARTVSEILGCSTQPVMYHFKTIADLKEAAYQKADNFHTEFIMDIGGNPMKDIGLNYIRFAKKEKNLFCFLFQSDMFSGKSILELISSEEIYPVLEVLAQKTQTNIDQAKMIFKTLFLYIHGYASMIANNSIEYDEEETATELDTLLEGAVYASKKGGK